MAHKKIIDSVKRQGQVAIKDLDEFLRFVINEYDMRTVAVTEPCDGFTGCWELKDEDTNTVYRAHVMTKSNLN